MTSGSAPARATAPILPRVLWVEGRMPFVGPDGRPRRLLGPPLSAEDARVAFALVLPDAAAIDLPLLGCALDAPIAPSSDPRWEDSAFVASGPGPREHVVMVRRSTLERLAARGGGLSAALAAALAEWSVPERRWRIAGGELRLRQSRPQVVGIVNVTPDSFSDGGRFADAAAAVAHGEALAAAGAAVLDVGGESTRPGSEPVPLQQELDRTIAVVEALARRVPVPISIDTTKAAVARAALAAGAAIVNDTSALAGDPEMAELLARAHAGPDARGAGVILMHRRGAPRTMQDDPRYEDCAAEVAGELAARAGLALGRGIPRAAIVLDPGIGFGKRLADNLELIVAIGSLRSLGYPVMLGASRKSFLGTLTGRAAGERDAATLATTAAAFLQGCELVRVHDVAGSVDVIRVLAAIGEGAP